MTSASTVTYKDCVSLPDRVANVLDQFGCVCMVSDMACCCEGQQGKLFFEPHISPISFRVQRLIGVRKQLLQLQAIPHRGSERACFQKKLWDLDR